MTGIAVNARFMTRPPTGVDRFAMELLRAWLTRFARGRHVRAIVPAHRSIVTSPPPGMQIETAGVLAGHAWEQVELPARCRDDMLLSLCNTGPLAHRRQLVVLHDAGVMANPATYSFAFRNWYRWLFAGLMRRARIVATVSRFSATELLRHVGGRAAGIEVIYGAGEHVLNVAPDTGILDRLGLTSRRYVLAVGSRTPNKNFEGVVKAAALLTDLGIRIVVAGGSNPRVFAGSALRGDRLVMAGYVSDAELRALYENAACFVFPSFYEGFGLPPLEAMHCGCPVIVSRRASLPEVCADAALYCDPDDPADIARQLRRLLGSPTLQNELRAAGFARASAFSWSRAAERLEEFVVDASAGRWNRPGTRSSMSTRPRGATTGSLPVNVLHAAENIKGGVGVYLRELLPRQRSSFGLGAVTAVVPSSQLEILECPAGVRIVPFDDSSNRLINAVRLAARVRELILATRPDVVHLHSTFAGSVLRPLLWLNRRGAKIVYCPHGWAFDRESSAISRHMAALLERVLAPLCDAIVCISEHEMLAVVRCGIPSSRLVLVRNGVPKEAPLPACEPSAIDWPAGKLRVLFVGRLDRQKGVDVLLEAASELQDEVFVHVVGESVLGDLRGLRVPGNAHLTGWLSPSQLEAYYRSADVLVVPSRWEGFGLAAAEAMRAGLPVIASRVGGLQELVEDGVTGLLVAPGNKTALVSALRGLSEERLRAMGAAGRERFLSHFTVERMHGQLLELYRREVLREDAREYGSLACVE